MSTWTCDNCETHNEEALLACDVCGADRPIKALWHCPNCETSNPDYFAECEVCGVDRVEELVISAAEANVTELKDIKVEGKGFLWEVPGMVKGREKVWVPVETGTAEVGRTARPIKAIGFEVFRKFKAMSRKAKRGWINGTLVGIGFFSLVILGWSTLVKYLLALGLYRFVRAVNPGFRERMEKLMEKKELPAGRGKEVEKMRDRYDPGHMDRVIAVAFSKEGDELISVDEKGYLRRWDIVTGERKQSAHVFKNPPSRICIGRFGAIALKDAKLQFYNSSARLKDSVPVKFFVSQDLSAEFPMTLSHDNQLFTIGSISGNILAWDLEKNRRYEISGGAAANVSALSPFSGEKKVLIGDTMGGVEIWNIMEGKSEFLDIRQDRAVVSTAVSRSGRFLAAGYDDSEVHVWTFSPVASKTMRFDIQEYEAHRGFAPVVKKMSFIPGTKFLMTIDQIGQIKIWDCGGNSVILLREMASNCGKIADFSISRDGIWLAVSGTKGQVAVFRLDGKKLRETSIS